MKGQMAGYINRHTGIETDTQTDRLIDKKRKTPRSIQAYDCVFYGVISVNSLIRCVSISINMYSIYL